MRKERIEWLASHFHRIYQKEAKRQGDVRHKDDYYDLPENIKEFDRVLARYVIGLLKSYTVHLMQSNEKAKKMLEKATNEQLDGYCTKRVSAFLQDTQNKTIYGDEEGK